MGIKDFWGRVKLRSISFFSSLLVGYSEPEDLHGLNLFATTVMDIDFDSL